MRKTMTIILVFVIIMFSGCYDNRETDTLATVMAVGIDKSEKDEYKIYTFAVADTGGVSGADSGDGASLICFVSEGRNAHEAIRDMDWKLTKELSFSHLSAILFSESVAKEGMFEDINHFENEVSVRPQTMIAITDTDAGDYLSKLKPVLESNPEKYFQSIFKSKNASISDFINAFYTNRESFVPIIKTSPAKEYSEMNSFADTVAVVHNGRTEEK